MYIPLNVAAYTPNTLNNGSPRQANQTTGRGFFTAPNRSAEGKLVRTVSSTFADVWSQPRLFFNSLLPVEQQFVINAMRFEASQVKSNIVKNNVLIQLNRVSHDVASRVAVSLGLTAPAADPTYYHDNTTTGVSVAKDPLLKIDGLKVGYLASGSMANDPNLPALRTELMSMKVDLIVVAELLGEGVNQTYSASDASAFDAIIVGSGTDLLFSTPSSLANLNTSSSATSSNVTSTLYPAGRPLQILQDGYRWGKPVAAVRTGIKAFDLAGIQAGSPGVYSSDDVKALAESLEEGLKTFKFLDRFPVDQ